MMFLNIKKYIFNLQLNIKLRHFCLTFEWWILVFILGCASNSVHEYVKANPNLKPEKIVAFQEQRVINGMTSEEVLLSFGKPQYQEKKYIENRKAEIERWVYIGHGEGMKEEAAYTSGSAFPSGIGFVIPLHYRSHEIQIDFHEGKVFRVEEILNY